MSCTRCDGFLVSDEFIDLWEVNGPMEFQGARCLNCGHVEDAVILANQLKYPPSRRARLVGDNRGGRSLVERVA